MSSSFAVRPTNQTETIIYPNIPVVARFDFSLDQMTNLFVTQLPVLPPLSGFFYYPLTQTLIRNGAQYNTQPGSLTFRWITSNGTVVATMGSFTSALNVLTSIGSNDSYTLGAGAAGSGSTNDIASGLGSKGVAFGTGVGSPTVTVGNPGSSITAVFIYLIIPNSSSSAGSY
jgi:hypothetical protein